MRLCGKVGQVKIPLRMPRGGVGWENEVKETRLRGQSKVREGSICAHRNRAKLVPKWT